MNKYLVDAISVFHKIAEESLKVTVGNELLKTAIELAISYYMGRAFNDDDLNKKLKSGLSTFLNELKYFVGHDPRMVAVSSKDPSKVTFFQKIPGTDISDIESDESKRARTTLGKYIKRIFIKDYIKKARVGSGRIEEYMNDKFIDDFVQRVNLKIQQSLDLLGKDLDEISGQDLQDFYGVGAQSCMSGGDCFKMQILARNPDKVSLVTMQNKARALLWTTDDGTRVLDRIYPSGSKYILPFREWAKKQGYVVRENPDQVVSGTVELSDGKTHTITLNVDDVRVFPYLDTFRCGEFSKDLSTLTLSNNLNFGDCLFEETDGSFEGIENYDIKIEPQYPCPDCGDMFDIHDYDVGVNSDDETVCSSCAENYISCEECGDIMHVNDINRLDESYYCEGCYNNKTVECSDCGAHFDYENEGHITDAGYNYCDECASKYPYCKDCNKLLDDDVGDKANKIYNEDGSEEIYCEDCIDVEDIKKCRRCDKGLTYEPEKQMCNECLDEIEEAARESEKRQIDESIKSKQLMVPFSEKEMEVNKMIADASKEVRRLFVMANLLEKVF